jgi:acetyltransferase-like isoleucine patch superfamily enzyme
MITPRRIDFDGPEGLVRIGDRTFVGASHLVCRREIVIGDDVLVSWGERILAGNPARVIRQLHAHGGSA